MLTLVELNPCVVKIELRIVSRKVQSKDIYLLSVSKLQLGDSLMLKQLNKEDIRRGVIMLKRDLFLFPFGQFVCKYYLHAMISKSKLNIIGLVSINIIETARGSRKC